MMRRHALAVLVGLSAVAVPAAAQVGRTAPPPPPVEPHFDLGVPGRQPFPSDRFTVPDPGQRTGLRVLLPQTNCVVERSTCDEARLLNELDGFDLSPRLALPFTGPIDPTSVTARSVFLVRLTAGPPEATGVERLVWDPGSTTLYARPETLLEPETRYGLVVTRALRDAQGRPIRVAPGFRRLLEGREAAGPGGAQRQVLRTLMAALARRGVGPQEVAVASVFTTGSVSVFLEQARDWLDRHPPEPALITAPESGGRAWFRPADLRQLVLRTQVRAMPDAEGFAERPLPLALLPEEVGGFGIGWFWSPWYLGRDQRIVDSATARPLGGPFYAMPVPFVILLPAGSPPAGGWPLALVGHGYGGEMFGTALRIAGTLARQGIATAALTVVGHGGGPDGRLLVTPRAGPPLEVRVPGRGVDVNGDGKIANVEGLAPLPNGPLTALGLRDGLRQHVVDLMAFVRAIGRGLDVDGDGTPDTRGEPLYYVGNSLGGIYGTLFLAVEPRIQVGVLNVPGGPITEIARLSPTFRPDLRDVLGGRTPPLLNEGTGFREDLPLRGEEPVVAPTAGALAIQEFLARAEWLARRADPVAYARHLRVAPLPGVEPRRVLIQLATGDRIVPNPTSAALVRAGQLTDVTTLLRYDRIADGLPKEVAEPHSFLLRLGAPGVAGALARAAQEQVARFFASGGATIWDPDEAVPPPFTEPLFEVPASAVPERLGFPPGG